MMSDAASSSRPTVPAARGNLGLLCAGLTAGLGWLALVIECDRSVTISMSKGHGLAEALFFYFHFFTIITNIGIATLMTVSAVRLLKRRPLLPGRLYNAALVYILVTCVTYEIMLRSVVKPSGLQFFTDAVIHDVVPALMLLFWIAFAPRTGVRWRDALWLLAYPLAYFAMTLVAGALGEGYPYDFINVDKLGYPTVLMVAGLFVAIFYGLGLITTAVALGLARQTDRGPVSQMV